MKSEGGLIARGFLMTERSEDMQTSREICQCGHTQSDHWGDEGQSWCSKCLPTKDLPPCTHFQSAPEAQTKDYRNPYDDCMRKGCFHMRMLHSNGPCSYKGCSCPSHQDERDAEAQTEEAETAPAQPATKGSDVMAEDMTSKEAVLAQHPNARAEYNNCGMGSSYWLVLDGTMELGRAYCGAMSDTPVWDDAASRLRDPVPLVPAGEEVRLPELDPTEEDRNKSHVHEAGDVKDFPSFHQRERELLVALRANAALRVEMESYKRKLAILFDEAVYSDSLGVEGSGFTVCRWCGGGSSPGQGNFAHNQGCLFDDDALEVKIAEVWFDDEDARTQPEHESGGGD